MRVKISPSWLLVAKRSLKVARPSSQVWLASSESKTALEFVLSVRGQVRYMLVADSSVVLVFEYGLGGDDIGGSCGTGLWGQFIAGAGRLVGGPKLKELLVGCGGIGKVGEGGATGLGLKCGGAREGCRYWC